MRNCCTMKNQEIERKFLVADPGCLAMATRHYDILQGYLCADGHRTVRVRLRDDEGFLTIKGPSTADGLARFEWEKPISAADALQLFALCGEGKVHKTRYLIPLEGGLMCEVDVFHGQNEGLVMAEIELPSETTDVHLPAFLGKEVTGDPRYYNAFLSSHPFCTWLQTTSNEPQGS